MQHEIIYCQQWFQHYRKVVDAISTDEAERRHRARLSYTALLGGEESPRAHVQMLLDKKAILVGFLDEYVREYMNYQFQLVDDAKIFLRAANFRRYVDGTDSISNGETYSFLPTGEVAILEANLITNESREFSKEYDPSGHFIDMPPFGDFNSIVKEEWT